MFNKNLQIQFKNIVYTIYYLKHKINKASLKIHQLIDSIQACKFCREVAKLGRNIASQ
ncbi:hypothetical protein Hanom_Chr00s000004g01606251 [Helianthus anomalus]